MLIDQNKINCSTKIANEFNKYYVNVAHNLEKRLPNMNKSPLSYLTGNYPTSMAVPDMTIPDTIEVIKSLKKIRKSKNRNNLTTDN